MRCEQFPGHEMGGVKKEQSSPSPVGWLSTPSPMTQEFGTRGVLPSQASQRAMMEEDSQVCVATNREICLFESRLMSSIPQGIRRLAP